MTFAPSNEPIETPSPYQNTIESILSYLENKGHTPTVLFKRSDCVVGYKVNFIDLLPIIFPHGWNGPDSKRATKVSKNAYYVTIVTHHYHKCNNLISHWYCILCDN